LRTSSNCPTERSLSPPAGAAHPVATIRSAKASATAIADEAVCGVADKVADRTPTCVAEGAAESAAVRVAEGAAGRVVDWAPTRVAALAAVRVADGVAGRDADWAVDRTPTGVAEGAADWAADRAEERAADWVADRRVGVVVKPGTMLRILPPSVGGVQPRGGTGAAETEEGGTPCRLTCGAGGRGISPR
jgi:hypothetical protein